MINKVSNKNLQPQKNFKLFLKMINFQNKRVLLNKSFIVLQMKLNGNSRDNKVQNIKVFQLKKSSNKNKLHKKINLRALMKIFMLAPILAKI